MRIEVAACCERPFLSGRRFSPVCRRLEHESRQTRRPLATRRFDGVRRGFNVFRNESLPKIVLGGANPPCSNRRLGSALFRWAVLSAGFRSSCRFLPCISWPRSSVHSPAAGWLLPVGKSDQKCGEIRAGKLLNAPLPETFRKTAQKEMNQSPCAPRARLVTKTALSDLL